MGLMENWQNEIPVMGKALAIVILIINVFYPSVGTFLMACISGGEVKKSQLIVGFLQLISVIILLGWLWSIYWGILAVKKSSNKS